MLTVVVLRPLTNLARCSVKILLLKDVLVHVDNRYGGWRGHAFAHGHYIWLSHLFRSPSRSTLLIFCDEQAYGSCIRNDDTSSLQLLRDSFDFTGMAGQLMRLSHGAGKSRSSGSRSTSSPRGRAPRTPRTSAASSSAPSGRRAHFWPAGRSSALIAIAVCTNRLIFSKARFSATTDSHCEIWRYYRRSALPS